LISDGADATAWAQCPECRALFRVPDAAVREIRQALVVADESDAANEETMLSDETAIDSPQGILRQRLSASSAPTISEFPSLPADEEQVSGPRDNDTVAIARTGTTVSELPQLPDTGVGVEAPGHGSFMTGTSPTPSQIPPPADTEDSTDRIDKWFRSATTAAERPPLVSGDDRPLTATYADPITGKDGMGATIEFDATALSTGDANENFELEERVEPTGGRIIGIESERPEASPDFEFETDDGPISHSPRIHNVDGMRESPSERSSPDEAPRVYDRPGYIPRRK
jgi:hypothetical protein